MEAETVKFGTFLLGDKPPGVSDQQVFQHLIDETRKAEELGFDYVWVAEHHFAPYGTFADLMVALAAVAAATERIRIGTACIIPHFHNPVNLAESIAMVDVISGGRVHVGFGRGYQKREFDGFGIPMEESTERFRESVTIIDGLLSNESFSYEGKYWQVKDLSIYPRPIQSPRPPFSVAVMRTPASFEWITDKGYDPLMGNPYQVDPELGEGLEIYSKMQRAKGLPTGTENVWALLNAFVSKDEEFARTYPRKSTEYALDHIKKYSDPFEKDGEIPAEYAHYKDWFKQNRDQRQYDVIVNSDLTLYGSPETVIRKLSTLVKDVGWQNFMLCMNRGGAMERAPLYESMELFAQEVMPEVRRIAAEQEA